MSIRLETIEAESRNSSNNNKNKHQWLLRKCLRIRSSPHKKNFPFLNSLNFVVRRRLFTYVVMWVVQDRERASSHTFGCHFWTTSSLWWNYKVHSSLSLFVCLFLGLFCFCFCPIHCLYYMSLFMMFYTLYTKMNLDLLSFSFSFQRLYINYACPFAQRVWITRNYKVIFMSFLNSFLDFVLSCSILKLYISSF